MVCEINCEKSIVTLQYIKQLVSANATVHDSTRQCSHALVWCHPLSIIFIPSFQYQYHIGYFILCQLYTLLQAFFCSKPRVDRCKKFRPAIFAVTHNDHRPTNQLEISCSTWKIPTEALRFMQDVYGDDTMLRARAVEWHRRFKKGWEDAKDYPRNESPATSTTEVNVELVR